MVDDSLVRDELIETEIVVKKARIQVGGDGQCEEVFKSAIVTESVKTASGETVVEISEKTSGIIEEIPDINSDLISMPQITLTRGMASPLSDLLTEPSWLAHLATQFQEMYFHDLTRFLAKELNSKTKIFPPLRNVFNSMNSCPFPNVKVVILGQDPYHDDGQAMGLSFSVPKGLKLPSSLLNIFKELESDLGVKRSKNGDLSKWAKQGVLLLNAVLTVRAHQANSHEGKGWERFTDFVIRTVSEKCENVVFMLWGKFAEKKAARVDGKRHLVLKSPHPSGLSASRGFFGCKHFSKANAYLKEKGRGEIQWALDELDLN